MKVWSAYGGFVELTEPPKPERLVDVDQECPVCLGAVESSRAVFCSNACRQKAYRSRV